MSQKISAGWRAQGDSFAADHRRWEFQARTLFAGALACWERHFAASERVRVHGLQNANDLLLTVPAHFLAALGLELLLKALSLKRNPLLSGQNEFYSHNLVAIASQYSGLSLSADELAHLRRMATIIEWAGRYPVPKWTTEKNRTKYDVSLRGEEGAQFIDAREIPGVVSHETWKATEDLFARLQRDYNGEQGEE